MARNASTNSAIGFTPIFRPPALDMKGRKDSRSYDIWSLGCIFLEYTYWIVGGYAELQRFSSSRISPNTLDSGAFCIAESKDSGKGYSVMLKESVTEVIYMCLTYQPSLTFVSK